MKTLFNKLSKNLILPLAIAGSLATTSYSKDNGDSLLTSVNHSYNIDSTENQNQDQTVRSAYDAMKMYAEKQGKDVEQIYKELKDFQKIFRNKFYKPDVNTEDGYETKNYHYISDINFIRIVNFNRKEDVTIYTYLNPKRDSLSTEGFYSGTGEKCKEIVERITNYFKFKEEMKREAEEDINIAKNISKIYKEFKKQGGFKDFQKFCRKNKGEYTSDVYKLPTKGRYFKYDQLKDNQLGAYVSFDRNLLGTIRNVSDVWADGESFFCNVYHENYRTPEFIGPFTSSPEFQIGLAKRNVNGMKKIVDMKTTEKEKIDDKVIEFTKENEQVYKDFVQFLKDRDGKDVSSLEDFEAKAFLDTTNDLEVRLKVGEEHFLDKNGDGMNGLNDAWSYHNFDLVDAPRLSLSQANSELQFGLAKIYTNIIKEMMNKSKEEELIKEKIRELNEKNKPLYKDFKEFLKEKEGKYGGRYIPYIASLDSTGSIDLKVGVPFLGLFLVTENFVDKRGNGIVDDDDMVSGQHGPILMPLKNVPLEDDKPYNWSKASKEYIKTLKKIMHNEGRKGY